MEKDRQVERVHQIISMATLTLQLTPLQRRLTTSTFYTGANIRETVLDHFKVKDDILEGLLIFPKRVGCWRESVNLSDLEKHIPNLSSEEMKRSVLALNVALASQINGSIPDQAFSYFGFTLGERLQSGLYAVSKFDASKRGYRIVEQGTTDTLDAKRISRR